MTTRFREFVERINQAIASIDGMDQARLARESGVNAATVNRLVNGKRSAEPEALRAICDVLKITSGELAYYIGLTDVIPTDKAAQREIFSQEWDKATPERRREMLEFLKLMNRLDRGE